MQVSSPHLSRPLDTGTVMRQVMLATLPGIAALTWFFGWGTLVNIIWACALGCAAEAVMLMLRKRPVGFYLSDGSALVTALLLGIALPPYSPAWLIAVGMLFAIVVAKHLYGGLGYNPFNPAMVGYVVLLISFPVEMTSWAAPAQSVADQPATLSLLQAFAASVSETARLDAFTMATPLDVFKQNNSLMVDEIWAQPQFGWLGGYGWEWANIGFLLGGVYLLKQRIFTWHAPLAMLIALALMAALFYDGGSSRSGGSPLFHLFTGATMLGAFFIVTDPVTSAVSLKGRLIYGAGVGILIYLIRSYGNYPDAIAFSVLLMNFAAPLIDHYTVPKIYGAREESQS
jgi:electron transport complex protein RnfD